MSRLTNLILTLAVFAATATAQLFPPPKPPACAPTVDQIASTDARYNVVEMSCEQPGDQPAKVWALDVFPAKGSPNDIRYVKVGDEFVTWYFLGSGFLYRKIENIRDTRIPAVVFTRRAQFGYSILSADRNTVVLGDGVNSEISKYQYNEKGGLDQLPESSDLVVNGGVVSMTQTLGGDIFSTNGQQELYRAPNVPGGPFLDKAKSWFERKVVGRVVAVGNDLYATFATDYSNGGLPVPESVSAQPVLGGLYRVSVGSQGEPFVRRIGEEYDVQFSAPIVYSARTGNIYFPVRNIVDGIEYYDLMRYNISSGKMTRQLTKRGWIAAIAIIPPGVFNN